MGLVKRKTLFEVFPVINIYYMIINRNQIIYTYYIYIIIYIIYMYLKYIFIYFYYIYIIFKGLITISNIYLYEMKPTLHSFTQRERMTNILELAFRFNAHIYIHDIEINGNVNV